MASTVQERARIHAALGEPVRLALVEDLAISDRSPSDLAQRFDLPGNLLAHHLDVLEAAGLIQRFMSSGDRRRRYVRLTAEPRFPRPPGRSIPSDVLFVCSRNSARSQLAEAVWRDRIGTPARSAGTHPAARVHPRAQDAARRAGLDLDDARPQLLTSADAELVVTVCDRAKEALDPPPTWLHWSIPAPAESSSRRAYDDVIDQLVSRIDTFEEALR